jgi:hypothetical protein
MSDVVDGRGTRRRLQALMVAGYSLRHLGRHLEVSGAQVAIWAHAARVHPTTHDRVAAVFDRLWATPPRTDTLAERVSVSEAISAARARGFLPALAWDDIDTDEVPPPPDGDVVVDVVAIELAVDGARVTLTTHERRLAVEQLIARTSYTRTDIARMLGVDWNTVRSDIAWLAARAEAEAEQVEQDAA